MFYKKKGEIKDLLSKQRKPGTVTLLFRFGLDKKYLCEQSTFLVVIKKDHWIKVPYSKIRLYLPQKLQICVFH